MRRALLSIFVVAGLGVLGGVGSAAAMPASGLTASIPALSAVETVRWYHVRRNSRRMWVRGNLGRHACHIRRTSRAHRGRC